MWKSKTDLDGQTSAKKMKWNHQTLCRISIVTFILLGCVAIYNLRLDKQITSENRLNFTRPFEERSGRGEDIGVVSGEETQANSAAYSSQSSALSVGNKLPQINFSKIENPTPSFQNYAYISGDLVMDEDGIIRVKKDAIDSKNIQRHSIESEHIDGSSITSGKIKNNSILGKDINRDTEITVAEIIADDLTGLNLAITQSIDLGTNQISDGLFSGDWDFGSGNLTTSGIISGSFAGSFAPSGDVDMTNHIFTNIGNAGTDFDSSGGLALAGNLVANGSLSGTTLNTGQGNYELYAMDQNVLTSSSPTFSGIILSGDLNLGTNTITISHTTLISNLNADYLDGNDSSYFLNTGTNFGGDVSGIYTNLQVSGLTASDFTSQNISQWTNNSNYITASGTITGLVQSTATGNSYFTGGNVGIGTTSPGSTLDIQAAGASQQIKSTTGTNSAYTNYANTGGTFRIGQDKSTGGGLLTDSAAYAGVIAHIGNYPLQFGTNNSIRMTVSNDGNVGIGTTSPNQKLDVNGNINTSGDLIVTNSDPTLVFASTSVGASVGAIHQSGNILSLGTLGLTDMFSLDLATGYVGIGTTAPLANLDINGDLRLSPQSTAPDAQEGKVYYDANDKSYKLYNGQETVAGEYIDLVADPHIQPSECPTGYVPIPGDARYGTAGGFCVMKYEAKCAATDDPTTGLTSPDTGYQTYANNTTACTSANSKQVVSTASGYPIANISQTDAKTYCSNLGEGYHLITNSEWMTIARNIEKRGENWTSGTVGTNGLYRGHSDNTPTTALAANSDDSEGYEGTGNSSPSQEKRTFALSNGEVIWDLSGNVYEWNQDTIKRKDEPHSTTAPDNTFGWKEFTTVDNYGTVSYASMRPSNPNWNATQNMGRFYTYNPSGDTNTTQYAFIRGGSWYNTTYAGLFTLILLYAPANTSYSIGLRCVFTP